MKTNQELLDIIEERCLGWSADCLTRPLLCGLSAVPELTKDMEAQARGLSKLVFKVDLLGQLRAALRELTGHDYRLRSELQKTEQTNLTFAPAPNSGDAAAIATLVEEIRRMEGEISSVEINYLAILRFLRQELNKTVPSR